MGSLFMSWKHSAYKLPVAVVLLACAVTALPLHEDVVAFLESPLDAKALNKEMQKDDVSDKRNLQVESIQSKNNLQVMKREESEADFNSKEEDVHKRQDLRVASAKAKAAAAFSKAKTAAKAEKDAADKASLDKMRLATKQVRKQFTRDNIKSLKQRGRKEHAAILEWKTRRLDARSLESQTVGRSRSSEERELATAKRARDFALQTARDEAAKTKDMAIRQNGESLTKVNRNVAKAKAKAAKVKATTLQQIRINTGQVLDRNQPMLLLETDATSQKAEAGDEAEVESEVKTAANKEKLEVEQAASQQSQEEAAANQKRTNKVAAIETLATQKIENAKAIFSKAKAIAQGTEAALKKKATQVKEADYIAALKKRQDSIAEARRKLHESKHAAAARAKARTEEAKGMLDTAIKKNKQEFERAKQNAKTEQRAAERAAEDAKTKTLMKAAEAKAATYKRIAAGGAVSGTVLIQLQENGKPKMTASMSSAELAKVQEEERKQDAKAANDMIADSARNTDDVIQAKKEADISKAETDAVNKAEEASRKAKAMATEEELKRNQDADDAWLNAVELANKRFRTAKEEIGQEAGAAKVRATEAKSAAYRQATAKWEKTKAQARKLELEKFRRIEEKESQDITKKKQAMTAAAKAIEADAVSKLATQRQIRKEEYAAANQEDAKMQSKIMKTKAAQMDQLLSDNAKADQQGNEQIPRPVKQSVTATKKAAAEAAAVSVEANQAAAAAASTPSAQAAIANTP